MATVEINRPQKAVAEIQKMQKTSVDVTIPFRGTVDSELSSVSTNPVQNKVITNALKSLENKINNVPQNLMVGTQSERLAYPAYDGLEWNEIGKDGKVMRWLYTEGKWEQIEVPQTSPVETVYLHVIKTGGDLVLTGIQVRVYNHTTGESLSNILLDTNGQAVFEITKGDKYTITMPSQDGYVNIPSTTFTASIDQHTITLAYRSISTPENPYEQVRFRVTAYNYLLEDTEELRKEFVGTIVTMDVFDGVTGAKTTFTATIDETYTAVFSDLIKWGDTYIIHNPHKDGFVALYDKDITRVASQATGVSIGYYMETPTSDVMLVDEDWKMYDYDTLSSMKDNGETLPTPFGLFINTSTLQENNASFFVKGLYYNQQLSKQWASQNIEFNKNELPYLNTLALASKDFDGVNNTDKIIRIGESLTASGKAVTTLAATYCRQQTIERPQIDESGNPILDEDGNPKKNTYRGYLPAFGELYQLGRISNSVIAIQMLYDNKIVNINSGNWWSSSQYSAPYAVDLYNGGFDNYGKTASLTTLPLFRPFSI